MPTWSEAWNGFGHWWVENRLSVWVVLVAVAVAVYGYRLIATWFGPHDNSSNGIAVGRAKQFDNRSLSLILEQLDASLQKLNFVSQSLAQNSDVFQESRSADWSRSLSLGSLLGKSSTVADKSPDPDAGSAQSDNQAAGSGQGSDAGSDAAKSKASAGSADKQGFSPQFGSAAGDVLTDQMNLAYQIINLRVLNERALSDRLQNGAARLQVVLGFQVSINPPRYAKDCVAVAEIELKLPGGVEPISVVAMIPQEKTYNAATLSSSSDSLDGSVVSAPWRLGAAVGRRRNNVFLHRDSDTVAFERNSGWYGAAFGLRRRKTLDRALSAFGWEFRPVLGRRSVSPGARQMLAVVSLPLADTLSTTERVPPLKVRTRTYWRHYHRRQQTSSVVLGPWPLPLSGPRTIKSEWYDVPVLRTADIQESLSPKVAKVDWTDTGGGTAIVLVEGENFFSGTEVTIGGARYRAGDGKLILKSERAMEIHTTVAALAKGDAVLSGRYGASIPLEAKTTGDPLPGYGINIVDSRLRVEGVEGKFRCLGIPLVSAGGPVTPGGSERPLTPGVFERTPHPIICVDDVVIPQPYYFDDGDPQDPPNSVVARCFVPTKTLDGATSVLFKTPFMGANWAPTSALSEDTVTITRIGGDALIIAGTLPFFEPSPGLPTWLAVLDQDYRLAATGPFIRLTENKLKLTVPDDVIARYEKLHLSLGSRSYLLDLPRAAQAPAAASLDDTQEPPIVKKGSPAIIDFKGSALTQIVSIELGAVILPFQVYGGGSRLRLFLGETETAKPGKFDIGLKTAHGALSASIYVINETGESGTPKEA
jgi:hypothetical protein